MLVLACPQYGWLLHTHSGISTMLTTVPHIWPLTGCPANHGSLLSLLAITHQLLQLTHFTCWLLHISCGSSHVLQEAQEAEECGGEDHEPSQWAAELATHLQC